MGGVKGSCLKKDIFSVTTNIHMVLKSNTHSAFHTDSVETC